MEPRQARDESCSDTALSQSKQSTEYEYAMPSDTAETLAILCIVSLLDGADRQLLPSCFRALEADLGFSPSLLAAVALAQGLTGCLFAPVWGALTDRNLVLPHHLIAGGCAAWGVITFCLAFIEDASMVILLRILNGAAMATLSPVTSTLVADLVPPQSRGRCFSWLGATSCIGAMLASALATAMSEERFTASKIAGWRVAFAIIALLSVAIVPVAFKRIKTPSRHRGETQKRIESYEQANPSLYQELRTLLSYFEIPTFTVIVLQTCFGGIPWSAFTFSTMYLQYADVSDSLAGDLASAFLFSCAFGIVLGGFVCDALTRWNRFHGRPLAAQISSGMGIPLAYIYYQVVPRNPMGVPYWFLLTLAVGIFGSWSENGVFRPMLTEVVSENHRGRVVGVLIATSGSVNSIGGPMVALLAERVWGYRTQRRQLSSVPEDVRMRNRDALADALTTLSVGPWLICFIFCCGLHFTYKADVARQHAKKRDMEEIHDEGEEWLLSF